MDTHLAAYWLGRMDATLDANAHADEFPMPGLIRESFEGQRECWHEALESEGLNPSEWRKKEE